MTLLHLYRTPALSAFQAEALLATVKQQVTPGIRGVETEFCFNVAPTGHFSEIWF